MERKEWRLVTSDQGNRRGGATFICRLQKLPLKLNTNKRKKKK